MESAVPGGGKEAAQPTEALDENGHHAAEEGRAAGHTHVPQTQMDGAVGVAIAVSAAACWATAMARWSRTLASKNSGMTGCCAPPKCACAVPRVGVGPNHEEADAMGLAGIADTQNGRAPGLHLNHQPPP